MNRKFKRVFLIVMDSAGIGYMPDAAKFGDEGSSTFVHAALKNGGLHVPNMEKFGLGDLNDIIGVKKGLEHKQAYALRVHEASNGKDTMTGHWEMMGIHTTKPFKTFTDTGFPEELIKELEEKNRPQNHW